MILKVLKIARALSKSRVSINHELYSRSCDFLFIVHSTKLRTVRGLNLSPTRRFHGNLIGTPTEYNLGLIVLLSTNQN